MDEQGNVVKSDFTQVKTLAVNNQIIQAQRKKENPYLAHKQVPVVQSTTTGINIIISYNILFYLICFNYFINFIYVVSIHILFIL